MRSRIVCCLPRIVDHDLGRFTFGMSVSTAHPAHPDCRATNTSDSRARAVIRIAATKPEMANSWVMKLCRRRHKNIAAVALAAKNTRTAWALLVRKQVYQLAMFPYDLA
ncbi:hypothetical protein ABH944_008644 [Caballeronia udeis]|uniref:Transposase IS116/IS110/IS902 family protein n=1 Tax=Caballeronia udeis TaxID=1232866 RepID=A0ABW8N3Q8_9BURK